MKRKQSVRVSIMITSIFIGFYFFAIASSCNNSSIEVQEDIKNVSTLTYEIVKIEGMTCIKWGRLSAYKGAITCNWDEWEKIE